MKRLVLSLFILTLTLILTGCVFDVQTTEMMRPPKLATELDEVKTALGIYYGTDMKLINPSSGDQTGAIQFVDLDGDTQKEAVAFFKDQNEQNALKVAILTRNVTLSKWYAQPPIVGVGYDIDQVDYPDLDNDGIKEIAIGWLGGSALNKGLSIYRKSDDVPLSPQDLKGYEEIFREVYTLFQCVDLNSDGRDELLTLHLLRPNNKAEARMYTLKFSGIELMDKVSLAGDVQRYERISAGIFDQGKTCIAIDASLIGGETFTEILMEREGKLVNIFDTTGSSKSLLTFRTNFRLTEDVDHNGWLEIPTLERPMGYESTMIKEVPWITVWNHVDQTSQLIPVFRTYDQSRLGFRFVLPEKWKETVSLTSTDQGVVFVEYQQGENERKKIFEITSRPRSEADRAEVQMLQLGYFELSRAIDYVYYGKLYDANTLSNPGLSLTQIDIESNFQLLN